LVNEILLDGYPIEVSKFISNRKNGLQHVTIEFPVTSERYHDVTTLLYKGEFDVNISGYPAFRAKILHYSTSVTNLYENGQIGQFKLELSEVHT
jgi:hypothetical protein